jgi:hypothetical protein
MCCKPDHATGRVLGRSRVYDESEVDATCVCRGCPGAEGRADALADAVRAAAAADEISREALVEALAAYDAVPEIEPVAEPDDEKQVGLVSGEIPAGGPPEQRPLGMGRPRGL